MPKHINKQTVLTVASIVGLGATTVLAVRSGMKTRQTLDAHPEATETKQKVKLVWKHYIATVVSLVATGGAIILSNRLTAKQITALSALSAAGASTFSNYRSKVSQILGPEEEKKIFDAVKAESGMTVFPEVIDLSEYADDILFYDELSKRYFYASLPRVFGAIYHLNRKLSTEGVVYVDDWFDFLAIDRDPALSESTWHYEYLSEWFEMGWINPVIIDEKMDDGTPYKRISFAEPPISPEELKEADPDLYEVIY